MATKRFIWENLEKERRDAVIILKTQILKRFIKFVSKCHILFLLKYANQMCYIHTHIQIHTCVYIPPYMCIHINTWRHIYSYSHYLSHTNISTYSYRQPPTHKITYYASFTNSFKKSYFVFILPLYTQIYTNSPKH